MAIRLLVAVAWVSLAAADTTDTPMPSTLDYDSHTTTEPTTETTSATHTIETTEGDSAAVPTVKNME